MSLHLLCVRCQCRDQTVYGGPWSHLFPILSFGKPYFRNSKESKTSNSLICHQLKLDIQDLVKKNSMKRLAAFVGLINATLRPKTKKQIQSRTTQYRFIINVWNGGKVSPGMKVPGEGWTGDIRRHCNCIQKNSRNIHNGCSDLNKNQSRY